MLQIPLSAILLSLLVHTLWGGVAVAGKFGLEVFPPFWSAFLRFVFGIATVWLWCWYRKLRIWPTPEEWKPLIGISLFFTVQISVMNLGIDRTSGINSSILLSVNPLFAAVFAHLMIRGDQLTLVRTTGFALAFLGVVLTMLSTSQGTQGFDTGAITFGQAGDWLCLGSAALLGFRLIISARALRELNPIRLAFWQMVLSLPLFLIAGLTFESIRWDKFNYAAIVGIAYQGVVVAGIGFMVLLWLMSRYRASTMASFNFAAPVSGVLLSAWLLNETITQLVLWGVLFVALGMVLLTAKFRSR